MGLAVLAVLAFCAVVPVIAVGAGRPGASAAVGVGVNGQAVHRFCPDTLMNAAMAGPGPLAELRSGNPMVAC